jgi:pyruvate dehydrogenase E2 component (dihydrolipoamide acetyltransferase)
VTDGIMPVPLPHMGVSVEEATVVAWLTEVGDAVKEGDPLCEISTDKVETEIAAPADGILARIVAAVGETVPVGALLAELAAGTAGSEFAAVAVGGERVGADASPGRFDPAHAARAALDHADVPHQIVATSHARRVIAEHMIHSLQTAAHMTTEAEIDMSAALRAREALNADRLAAGQSKLTPLALIARACCTALAEFPDLNATFETDRLIRWGEINLGIAVDTPPGLLVPVIRGCQRLTAPAIADAIADLATKARTRTLTPDDMQAGTFTISNPGSVGAHSAMAIINQPQVAILGIPVIVRRPAVAIDEHGQETIGIRPLMMLALTFDHRAIDGAYATRCLVAIKQLLQSWGADAYG